MAARDGLARDEQYAVTERLLREAMERGRGNP